MHASQHHAGALFATPLWHVCAISMTSMTNSCATQTTRTVIGCILGCNIPRILALQVPGLWAWGCKVLASLWVIGGMFDLLRSLLWMREGPTSGILGGYRYALGVLVSAGTSSLSLSSSGSAFLQGYELVKPPVACLTRVTAHSIMAFSVQRMPSFTL